jgi:DNA-directed RNA polymerase subunit alpha
LFKVRRLVLGILNEKLMKNLFLANKIDYQPDKDNKNKGEIIIEPCWPGYGITWGNALRRVLLTSLPGAAVTAVKIRGVKYEFAAIEGIKEDVLEIILNLKSLHLKILSDKEDAFPIKLKAKGKKKVTAADIEKHPDVEIANQDLLIATLTDEKAILEMDVWVRKGYGWVPSEEKSRDEFSLDTIIMDSIFSPVLNVSVNVENMRVGKKTNFDRIFLGVETNGTITPLEAFLQASDLLKEQFRVLNNLGKEIEIKEKRTSKSKKIKKTTKTKKTVKKKNKKKIVSKKKKK